MILLHSKINCYYWFASLQFSLFHSSYHTVSIKSNQIDHIINWLFYYAEILHYSKFTIKQFWILTSCSFHLTWIYNNYRRLKKLRTFIVSWLFIIYSAVNLLWLIWLHSKIKLQWICFSANVLICFKLPFNVNKIKSIHIDLLCNWWFHCTVILPWSKFTINEISILDSSYYLTWLYK